MRELEKLMDLKAFRQQVQEAHGLDVSDLKVQFENPVQVYPMDLDADENTKFDKVDVQMGTAQIIKDGDDVLGDIELLPHLETFYSSHPSFRPSYMPIAQLVADGNKATAIVIQWIKAYVP